MLMLQQIFSGVTAENAGRFHFSPPYDASHGDLACNAAMMLAKSEDVAAMVLAETIAEHLRNWSAFAEVSVVKPGFINARLKVSFLTAELARILSDPDYFSHCDVGAGKRVNIEYVSANPTGPLHVGHARGAVFGDALSVLLTRTGYDVTREYYINDVGVQVDVLARSAHGRYLEALGDKTQTFDAPLYSGEYLIPVGGALAARFGTTYQNVPESEYLAPIREYTIAAMIKIIRSDLQALGVVQDVFTSERALVESGAVEQTLTYMQEHNLVYRGVLEPPRGKTPEDWEPREQLLFRSSDFGDDIDRPLIKSDGTWSYFTPDITYHRDKFARNFDWLINIFGADHIGYVKRLKAAAAAFSEVPLDILCCQIVRFIKNGAPVRMSKRQGTFITLRELIAAVGKDVVRLHLLGRKNDAHMDFDLELMRQQSLDNPVFYIQYAHARCHSAISHAKAEFSILPEVTAEELAAKLITAADHRLLCKLAEYSGMLRRAGSALEVHRIALYLRELAKELHGFWSQGKDQAELRVVVRDDALLTAARCQLLCGVKQVLADGLGLLGVTAVDELR
ncbi:MAG: arginine--tRNA ligase [Alphaproteobacteria bacterium]|nr:arginine--tRNA ligase [Alphaproteobacteria bacterium]